MLSEFSKGYYDYTLYISISPVENVELTIQQSVFNTMNVAKCLSNSISVDNTVLVQCQIDETSLVLLRTTLLHI